MSKCAEGLQAQYNHVKDRTIRNFTHMILALACVPPEDVADAFSVLHDEVPDELLNIMDYFSTTYVNGRPARGRRRGVAPRYPVCLWNHYQAALQDLHETNNASEGWHTRFSLLVGKYHPDMYTFLSEIQKERGDTDRG